MGLFKKKDPCAICGGVVKGLLPWKIEGQYVCNDCYGVVDLPDDAVAHMSIGDFRGYMAFREENKLLRERFQVTQKVDFGWLDTKFMFDMENRLLCMDKHLNKTIFEGGQIQSFTIKEDDAPLFEGSASGLLCYASCVPDRVAAMAPQIEQYRVQAQMRRDAERMMDRMDDGERNFSTGTYLSGIDIPEPFQKFYVRIVFDHPYWNDFTADMGGPSFDNDYPDADSYLRDYKQNAAVMEQLADALTELAFPDAPKKTVASPATAAGQGAPGAAVDAVEEIRRFKTLMEQGAITEEEFTAKKRQLLGI